MHWTSCWFLWLFLLSIVTTKNPQSRLVTFSWRCCEASAVWIRQIKRGSSKVTVCLVSDSKRWKLCLDTVTDDCQSGFMDGRHTTDHNDTFYRASDSVNFYLMHCSVGLVDNSRSSSVRLNFSAAIKQDAAAPLLYKRWPHVYIMISLKPLRSAVFLRDENEDKSVYSLSLSSLRPRPFRQPETWTERVSHFSVLQSKDRTFTPDVSNKLQGSSFLSLIFVV